MNDADATGELYREELVPSTDETPAQRRKRMNMLRMRRNRKNPAYRADEQRRQRERRRQRMEASKATRTGIGSHSTVPNARLPSMPPRMATRVPPLRLTPIEDMETNATITPEETAVVQIPTINGLPVLPSVVTFSVFAPVPSKLTMVVVTGDSVKSPRTAVHVSPTVGYQPNPAVQRGFHIARNLNLDAFGGHWYSHEEVQQQQQQQPLINATVPQQPTPRLKKEV